MDVVLKWERRRLREMAVASSMDVDVSEPEPSDSPRGKRRLQTSPTAANSPRKRLTQSPTSMGAPTTELSYSPAQVGQIGDLRLFEQNDILAPFQSYREIIINYLIRFICTINEPLLRKGLSWRIVELVRGFLAPELWADVNVKIGFLEKYFASAEVNEANATNMPNILQVLRFVFEKRGVTWYVDNLPHLQSCVQKILASEQVKVIDGLVAILAHVYKQIGEYQEQQQQPVPAPIATFTQLVMTLVVEGLQQARNIYGIVMTLSALRPASNEYVPHLMKLFSR